MNKTVSIITLGCKVNFTDSQQIARTLIDRGYSVVFDYTPADVSIINTCAVTSRADYQSRQAIRRTARLSGDTPVIVTGCASSLFSERIREAAPASVVVPPMRRDLIADAVSSLIGASDADVPDLSAPARTRAFLKIQEGCNAGCAYCIVPLARGRERSIPPGEVLHQVSGLVERGYKEIVLVGIHLGRYGNDLDGESVTLAGLLRAVDASLSQVRVRLSSIEPMEFTDELLEVTAQSRLVAPHLHIPLQSGDDSILESMGRPYRRDDFERIIRRAVSRLGDPAVGVDVMVGFPGEGDREFLNTVDLMRSLPVTYLHVFPFSRRPNTRAFTMEGQVPSMSKKTRARIVRELGMKKKDEYIARNIEKQLTVLVESHDSGLVRGKSENYLDVYLPGTPDDINSFISVIVERPFRGGAYGRRSV